MATAIGPQYQHSTVPPAESKTGNLKLRRGIYGESEFDPTITVFSRHNEYASSYKSCIHFGTYYDSDALATRALALASCDRGY